MNAEVTQIPATARLLRVADTQEFFGLMESHCKDGTSILAEGLQSLCDQDIFVVSYESQGDWRVFIGEVATDHGIVETPEGLHLRSLTLRPSDQACVRL